MAWKPKAKEKKDPFANMDFSEDSDYDSGEGMSLNEIFLRHIRKISDLCCGEFCGSWWEKTPVRTDSGILFTEVYHEDKREAFCNAIDFLVDVLYPLSDDEFRKYVNENEDPDKEEQDIKKKLLKKRKTFKQINIMFDRINFWKNTGVANY